MNCLTFVAAVAVLIAAASAQDPPPFEEIDFKPQELELFTTTTDRGFPVISTTPDYPVLGGWSEWMEVNDEVQAIVDELQNDIANALGNGDLESIEVLEFKQQVVAGFNYQIKLKVRGSATLNVDIFVFKNLNGDLDLQNFQAVSGCPLQFCDVKQLGCLTGKLKVNEDGCEECECSDPVEYMQEYAAGRGMVLCMVGDRGRTVSTGELFTNTAAAGFCNKGSKCGLYTYTMIESATNEEIEIEQGMCVDPDSEEYYTCDALREKSQVFGEVTSCEFASCEGDNCNQMTIQSDVQCDYTVKEGEFPLMPACSMRDFADRMHQCVETLYSGYPYEDKDQCRSRSQAAYECMGQAFMECSNSPCLSFGDWFVGFREQLVQIRSVVYLMQISESTGDAFDIAADFFNMTQADREYWSAEIALLECPTPGVVPQCIQDGLDWIRMSDFEDQVENMILDFMMGMGVFDESMDVEKFMQMAPCRKGYHAAVMKAFVNYLNEFYSSSNRDGVCQAFTTYKTRTNFAWNSMCDNMKVYTSLMAFFGEEEADFVDYMVQLLTQYGELFDEYQFPNCSNKFERSEFSRLEFIQRMAQENNQTICWVGERGKLVSSGMVYENTVAPALCGQGDKCANFNYRMIDSEFNQLLQIEMGLCAPADGESEHSCDTLREKASLFGQVTDCNYSSCDGNQCNGFKTVLMGNNTHNCSALKDENDLDLMPACSMKTFVHKVTGCMEDLYSGYPFSSRDQCRNRFNDALQCFGRVVVECTNSSCLSALDWIQGYRGSLSMIRSVAYMMEIKGPEAAFDMIADIMGTSEEEKMMIKSFIDSFECPKAGELPDMFQMAFDWIQSNDIEEWASQMLDLDLSFLNMGFCSTGYHGGEARALMDFLHNFYKATERQEVCQAFTAYKVKSQSVWDNMCDDNMVYPSLVEWLGEENTAMIWDMIKFLTNYGELFQSFELPNCPKQMHSDFHCERFYNNPSPCAMRKAWLCDYAQWKETFLSDWLSEFTRLNGNDVFTMMGTQQPMCESYDMGNMCKDSRMQKCFIMPVTGCLSCYCADHEYKDFRGIMAVWRKDYYVWQRMMQIYRQTLGNSNGGMTSSCDDVTMDGSGQNDYWDQQVEMSGHMDYDYGNYGHDGNQGDYKNMDHAKNMLKNMLERRRRR